VTGKIPKNTRIGDRYVIITLLGQGGMGAVYLVMDSRLGNKKCALKEMSDSAIQDPLERQQAIHSFRQEAQMLSSLSHPGLPRVTDYFSEGNKHFLVMDYVEGRSLAELLDTNQSPFPESRVLDWGEQLCDVLGYLHSQTPPIIYRDLKPENIIASTNRQRVRLIDFGAARTYKPKKGKDTTAIGTPGFAPPEQYGQGQTDARSDIYSLGATLHQLLTLHDPGVKLFHFPSTQTLNPAVSTHVDRAIAKAVEKDIHQRWMSTADFRDALLNPQPGPKPKQKSKPQPTPVKVSTVPVPAFAGKTSAGSPAGQLQTTSGKAKPTATPAAQRKFANHGPRFGAYLTDNIIVAVVDFLLYLPFMNSYSDEAIALMVALMVVWTFGYYTYFHAKSGQTPGKKAKGLKVICKDGKTPSWARALWRSIVFLALPAVLTTFLYIGWLLYLVPLVESENRALHDILAGTWVIQT
jgi:serine/threonine-protein kinase